MFAAVLEVSTAVTVFGTFVVDVFVFWCAAVFASTSAVSPTSVICHVVMPFSVRLFFFAIGSVVRSAL